ncbi:hypothetical protein GF343_06020 [Candidatus Woesearchaeota archaeon]|nr:hypothetical protein [Candidatus Woesearchaeota archaeon]
MKKLVLICLLFVLLSACAVRQTDKEQQMTATTYRVGTQGLDLRFLPNLPPNRLFDTDTFNAVIEIENKGAYTVGGPGDKLYLSGFDPSIITGILEWGEGIPQIDGRTQYVPQGGVDVVSFKGSIAPLRPRNIDKYPVRLLATACYEYETIAATPVCIDPDPYSPTTRPKICTPGPASLGGGQGGPIAVTQVEVDPSPGRTRFKIHIQNAGGGEVFRYGAEYLQKCSPHTAPLAFDEIDYVELRDVTLGGVSIKPTCKPLDRNHIRLTNGKGTVFCEMMTRGQDAYTTPMVVALDYGYRSSVFKDLEIVSVY